MNTETRKGKNSEGGDGNQQKALDQGGHAGLRGHGGQHSGGMGGEHGGDLHDVGSAQSGMTGGGGMGGNDTAMQRADDGSRQGADDEGDPIAEVQQSAQREGMGNHRHSSRGNEQALDATTDDDVGSHRPGAARPDS